MRQHKQRGEVGSLTNLNLRPRKLSFLVVLDLHELALSNRWIGGIVKESGQWCQNETGGGGAYEAAGVVIADSFRVPKGLKNGVGDQDL